MSQPLLESQSHGLDCFPAAGPSSEPAGNSGIRSFVGLGSNLGDRLGLLRDAAGLLAAIPGIKVIRSASIYESPPWGYLDQPAFLNTVVEIFSNLEPLQLLLTLQMIESRLGRQSRFRWGPREIDLDLLLYGDCSVARRGFCLPHPAMFDRVFVLKPLAELVPELTTPAGEPILRAIERLDPTHDQAILQATSLMIAR